MIPPKIDELLSVIKWVYEKGTTENSDEYRYILSEGCTYLQLESLVISVNVTLASVGESKRVRISDADERDYSKGYDFCITEIKA